MLLTGMLQNSKRNYTFIPCHERLQEMQGCKNRSSAATVDFLALHISSLRLKLLDASKKISSVAFTSVSRTVFYALSLLCESFHAFSRISYYRIPYQKPEFFVQEIKYPRIYPLITLSITSLQNLVPLNVFSKKLPTLCSEVLCQEKNMRLLMDCLLFCRDLNHKRFNVHQTQICATAVNWSLVQAIHSGFTCSQNH